MPDQKIEEMTDALFHQNALSDYFVTSSVVAFGAAISGALWRWSFSFGLMLFCVLMLFTWTVECVCTVAFPCSCCKKDGEK